MNNPKSDFEKWLKQWDVAAEQFAKEAADALANQPKPQLQTSFFNDAPMDRDYKEPELEAEPSWLDIYYRSQNIDGDDELITDGVQYTKGAEMPQQNFGAFTPIRMPPTQQSATGSDQEEEETGLVRVTQNWGAGGEWINELDSIKREIEQLERKHHHAEIKGESGFKTELKNLRDRVKSLSEKMNRGIATDVT